MNRRTSLALACLAASLPLSGKTALADENKPDCAPPAPSNTKAAADQQTEALRLSSEAEDAMNMDSDATTRGTHRRDQIRFTSEDGNLVLRPYVIAKGDLTEWDGRHTNPNYQAEFGIKGSWYHDVTYDFAGFVSYLNGLTWREANVGYRGPEILGEKMYFKGGLYDSIYWKEQGQVHDQNTLFLYRSLLTYAIGSVEYGNLVGGAAAFWGDPCGDEPLFLGFSVHEIANTQPFEPNLIGATTNLGAHHIGTHIRADWMPFGDRRVTHDLSGRIGNADTLDVGGGFAWDDLDNSDLIRMTLDAQYASPRHWTLFGALALNYTNFATAPNGVSSRTDWGFLVQGGYFFTPFLEGIARYDFTHIDGAFKPGTGRSHLQELSLGVNFYPGPAEWRNHVKVQAALSYLPDGTPISQDLNYVNTVPGKSRVFIELGGQIAF